MRIVDFHFLNHAACLYLETLWVLF
uniref:Uncharacterized protein n=1 Tax=Anguilla anguilla TaxID=7936 RepID=A0A0E9SWT9_ANGAN